MKDTGKIALRLLIITVAAGLVLGWTNGITKGPILEQERLAAEAARREVLDADSFTELDLTALSAGTRWEPAFDAILGIHRGEKDGQFIGTVVELSTRGYGGNIRLTVGIDAERKVTGVSIGSHGETPGLGAKATDPAFTGQYRGMSADTAIQVGGGTNGIEALSGATITSRGVTDGVNLANRAAVAFGREE